MKKVVSLLLSLVMLLSLVSCSSSSKKVVANLGEPGPEMILGYSEDSAMSIFCFDGETTTCKYIFDDAMIGEIVTKINSLDNVYETPDVLSAEWVEPAYGLTIQSNYGDRINLAYSNGLWITQYGDVYRAEGVGLERFFELAEDGETSEGGRYFPNSIYICEYDAKYYTKSEKFEFVDGVNLKITNSSDGILDMILTNNTDGNLPYGGSFKLQRKIGGDWYYVPESDHLITCIAGGGPSLLPGEAVVLSAQYSYNYNYLISGKYRVLLFRENHGFDKPFVAAEFKVK